ncbi:MAG: hypothetical protein H0V74_06590 [Chloroflexi bacterium]|nr:hypothetical protein [Chloroflexota bacterium]
MDQQSQLIALIVSAAIGVLATYLIIRRDRKRSEDDSRESRFAVSTEGMKRCPSCGMGNLVTDATCSSCHRKLP